MNAGNARHCAMVLLWCVIGVLTFWQVLRPVEDPDFWWHLKSGEAMVQQGGLLAVDPFSFTAQSQPDARAELILQGYWLWQLCVYGLYAAGGLYGAIVLKGVTLAALLALMFWALHRQRATPLIGIPLLLVGLWSVQSLYLLERPQVISFLGAGLLVHLFLDVREGRPPSWLLLPLMLLWANMHGGYVVGVLMLLAFAAGAALEYRGDPLRRRRILLWTAAGVAATLVNPLGYKVYVVLFNFMGQDFSGFVMEYMNTWDYFAKFNKGIALLWGLLALNLAGLAVGRPRYLPWLFLVGLVGALAVSYVRNVAFFTVALLPLSLEHAQTLLARVGRQAGQYLKVAWFVAGCGLLLALALGAWRVVPDPGGISDIYPKRAAAFIESNGLAGRIFSEHDWGGYLIWRLYPGRQVFIDGRGLDEQVFQDYLRIAKASTTPVGTEKEYAALLRKYQVEVVAQKLFQQGGILNPLMKYLMLPRDPDWVPVYLDQFAYVAVRNDGRNQTVIDRFGIDKRLFIIKAMALADQQIAADPGRARYYLGKAELLAYYGSYDSAVQVLAEARRLGGDPQQVGRIQREIEMLRGAAAR